MKTKYQATIRKAHVGCIKAPCAECARADEIIADIFTKEAMVEMISAWISVFAK